MPRHSRREPAPPSPHPDPSSGAIAAYQAALDTLTADNEAHRQRLACRFEPVLNAYLAAQSPENAGQKKALAQRVSVNPYVQPGGPYSLGRSEGGR